MAYHIIHATFEQRICDTALLRGDSRFVSIDDARKEHTFACCDRRTARALRDALTEWLEQTEEKEG